MLEIGVNSYCTLEEIKELCLEDEILSLSDDEIIKLAKKSFQWIETNYINTVFQYPKFSDTQETLFPRLYTKENTLSNGLIPKDIKLAQIMAMRSFQVDKQKEDKEIIEETLGERTIKYKETASKKDAEQGGLLFTIDSIIDNYRVKFL